MHMLDEIGLPEAAYRAAVVPFRSFVVGFDGHFETRFPVPMTRGRDYAYGIDRARFDHALWDARTLAAIRRRTTSATSARSRRCAGGSRARAS